ncbi:type II toxin-antitoxin system PemK/MazF family toxin [Conexibacter sp. JD483]|uniref:type II toxin-antitoxin system PemK/MazF family toxin n=1 Tax=unclassified Conexibacter TaxID=2627773 RepID=UPI002717D3F8|nr:MULTISPECIES: type II toxin-antitoxin system PemK/MazF family toxin [unclassified Conexibacter]MDO8186612.1 type II toxin-antitoxin system PemK/MazF family toxin [Conexibacter sp. CPCC 205706]MDO8196717.1 type II toxin-antitoxin system PemK/MazF family toxin [Conexibacter sp. CPCC 205762]MDR9370916.1 type II toxin-antitoxin system PemK/MazF family toxin [Conexibacter sp. JD483]
MVSRGDICWMDRPDIGRRPACVLTRNEAIPVLTKVTVAIVTSTIRGNKTEVHLTREDGVSRDCVISLDNLFTVERDSLERPIAHLSATKMIEVCRALDHAAGCGRR